MSYEEVIDIQQKENVLYGPAYTNIREYKLNIILENRYEILIMGTSRVMQFRPNFFGENSYNSGGSITRIEHILPLLERLNEDSLTPDILILGLDQYFFNQNWNIVDPREKIRYTSQLNDLNVSPNPSIRAMTKDVFFRKNFIHDVFNIQYTNNIGINARTIGTGFRYDGSLVYGDYIVDKNINNTNFDDSFNRINQGINRFQFSNEVNFDALGEIYSILEFAYENDIQVLGFLPPYSPSVYEYMLETDNYEYLLELPVLLEEIFTEFRYHHFFDYTIIENFDDTFFVDGFHGDYRLYQAISEDLKKVLD